MCVFYIIIEFALRLDDTQFYNRVDEISFLSDNLELTKKESTPTILLTGIEVWEKVH